MDGSSLMHILQITKYFYPALSFGGPVQCTYNLSKYLVSRGHKVTVYATDALDISSNARVREAHRWIDGIEVFYFHNIAKFYGFFVSPSMIRTLKENIGKFEVVHLHEFRTFQNLVFYFLNTKRLPYVLSCHGEFLYTKQSWDQYFLRKLFEESFGRRMVMNARKLIALTPFEQAQYIASGVEPSRIAVIPNGVACEDFSAFFSDNSFKTLYGMDNERIILYLGRINKDKGIDILVKAFSLLCKERSDCKLVLAGPDDGFLRNLRGMIKGLNLEGKVIFTGTLDRQQVAAAYNDSAVVVYASIHEGFPVVPLEAGCVGKPVIVTNIPAMDYVRKGGFGLTVSYGSVVQLKEAIDKILDNSEMSKEMTENGKKFVRRNYSWKVLAKKIEDIYFSILNEPAFRRPNS
jgi:glycosyltransferase involved in cell wall biosynthesis